MFAPRLPRIGTFEAWRDTARRLTLANVPVHEVDWGIAGEDEALFDAPLPEARGEIKVPAQFAPLARNLIPVRSGEGMALGYALLTRLQKERGLLSREADPNVARARELAKAIRRDIHKMHAFVRFREVDGPTGRRAFAAWFEPDHRIEEEVAEFFANRFGDMDWRIETPEVTITHAGGALRLEARGGVRPAAGDPLEELWTTYYSNIFNPARLKPDAMRAEMPRKYWRNLPETRAIPSLIADARARVTRMQEAGPSMPAPATLRRKEHAMPRASDEEPGLPLDDAAPTLPQLARDASACTRCPLYEPATQVVFGEGPANAPLMVVGEQPGDREDISGRPFVGPAGQLFNEVAAQAGLDREQAYVTNAVKHFKYVQRGKRRIHQKPAASEISACRWWLEQELSSVNPDLVLAMGATALHALTGNGAGILKRRSALEQTRDGRDLFVTVHPSYLLRLPDEDLRESETARFRDDLSRVQELLEERAA
ncbi:uracil-DNA glycosylase family domain protein [Jannaschia seosinensis]|uniref:Type-4 uracil-DNA glycosylase n=1 Tax=Jannaschia seosinensis TaxID=313367 RepID=A0A0M7B6T9_9RHOB|nr:UdgX family uracil-DNA binding protein [Jannaschia seosinensis]CUH13105.1 uracil-DNA glycosylase family domain protein [Jannaschia seosinensis]